MTGGRRGFCNTAENADAVAWGAAYGRGRGCRRGRFVAEEAGRGLGRGIGAAQRAVSVPMGATSPPDELAYLTQEAQNLEKSLQIIHKRIENLQPKSA